MKSITLRVTHSYKFGSNLCSTYRGERDYRSASFIRETQQFVPTERYRVRYEVNPSGPLEVKFVDFVVNPTTGKGYTVCFLRHLNLDVGTRLTRTVLPWKD